MTQPRIRITNPAFGEITRYSPTFSATGLTFTGSNSTYPTYNSYYVKNGHMVSFWIQIDLNTVTNFGTGQYKVDLPFAPYATTMNHFSAWSWVDPAVNPDMAEHVILQADHTDGNKTLDLHWVGLATPNPKPVIEHIFTQGSPVILTTLSKIYVNGTYFTSN